MSELKHARSFWDLLVYQKAKKVSRKVFELTREFPPEEKYSLTDQVRRSSRSVGAQIAEAWAKRRYRKHFISKLTDADGEQLETQHWIESAYDCKYITNEQRDALMADLSEIGCMLGSMIQKADSFCLTDKPIDKNNQ
ncbi:MAG: four helix bundle protein [Phycisphaerales bacterium]|jgi:four helix bundle protein|nr:four helix bundle protein [Phycisphaerales bacterium]